MTDQLALELRHQGQTNNLAAGQKVHADDRSRVEVAVAALARSGVPFTADHIHTRLADGAPYDRNLVSSVIGVWARYGHIREADIRPTASSHRERHASRNRWWTGEHHA